MRMLGFSLASWPEVGCRLPAMICSCVVLPAPLMPAGKAGARPGQRASGAQRDCRPPIRTGAMRIPSHTPVEPSQQEKICSLGGLNTARCAQPASKRWRRAHTDGPGARQGRTLARLTRDHPRALSCAHKRARRQPVVCALAPRAPAPRAGRAARTHEAHALAALDVPGHAAQQLLVLERDRDVLQLDAGTHGRRAARRIAAAALPLALLAAALGLALGPAGRRVARRAAAQVRRVRPRRGHLRGAPASRGAGRPDRCCASASAPWCSNRPSRRRVRTSSATAADAVHTLRRCAAGGRGALRLPPPALGVRQCACRARRTSVVERCARSRPGRERATLQTCLEVPLACRGWMSPPSRAATAGAAAQVCRRSTSARRAAAAPSTAGAPGHHAAVPGAA